MIKLVMKQKDVLSVVVTDEYYYLCCEKRLEKINIDTGEVEKKINYSHETYSEIFLTKDEKYIIAFSYRYGFVDILDVNTLENKYRYKKLKKYGTREDVYYDGNTETIYSIYSKHVVSKGFINYLTELRVGEEETVVKIIEKFSTIDIYYNYSENEMNVVGVRFLDENLDELGDEDEVNTAIISIGSKGIKHLSDFDNNNFDLDSAIMTEDGIIYYVRREIKRVSLFSKKLFFTLCKNSGNQELISSKRYIGFLADDYVVTIDSGIIRIYKLDSLALLDETRFDVKDFFIHKVRKVGANHFSILDGYYLYLYEWFFN